MSTGVSLRTTVPIGAVSTPEPVEAPAVRLEAGDAPLVGPGAIGQSGALGMREVAEARRASRRERLKKVPGRLLEKGLDKLLEAAADGKTVALGDHGTGAIRLHYEQIANTAPQIADDPVRSAITNALTTDEHDVIWVATGGILELSGEHAGALTIGEGGSFSAEGEAAFSYSTLRPYQVPKGASEVDARTIVGEGTLQLPLALDRLDEMPIGAEVELVGRGRAGGEANAGWVSGSASLDVGVGGEAARDTGLTVRRIDENRFQIVVTELDQRQLQLSADIRAGVDLSPIFSRIDLAGAKEVLDRVAEFDAADEVIDGLNLRDVDAQIRERLTQLNVGDLIDEQVLTKLEARLGEIRKDLNLGDRIEEELGLPELEAKIRDFMKPENLADLLLDEIGFDGLADKAAAGLADVTLGDTIAKAIEDDLLPAIRDRVIEEFEELDLGKMLAEKLGLPELEADLDALLVKANIGDRLWAKLEIDTRIGEAREELEKLNFGDIIADKSGFNRWESELRDALKPIDDSIAGLKKLSAKGRDTIGKLEQIARDPNLRVGVGHQRRRSTRDVDSFEIDRSTPSGRTAFRALVNLKVETAGRLVGQPGVRASRFDETIRDRVTTADVSFAGHKLLAWRAAYSDKHGQFVDFDGVTHVERQTAWTASRDVAFLGNREVHWEAISVRDGIGPKATLAEMRMTATDKMGSARDLNRIATFGRQLGFTPDGELDLEPERMGFLSRLFSENDDITFDLDVFFTKAGLDRIAGTRPADARATYVTKAAELYPKLAFLTELPDAKLDELSRLGARRLEHLRFAARTDGSIEAAHRQAVGELSARMTQIAGRTLRGRALDVLADADAFAANLADVGTANGEWTRAFADLGKQAGFGMMPTVATLASLAGTDETLVHRFAAESASARIVGTDEGRLEAPRLDIPTS